MTTRFYVMIDRMGEGSENSLEQPQTPQASPLPPAMFFNAKPVPAQSTAEPAMAPDKPLPTAPSVGPSVPVSVPVAPINAPALANAPTPANTPIAAPTTPTPANAPTPPVSAEASDTSTQINQELYKRNAELAVRNKTLALLRKLDAVSLSAMSFGDMAKEMVSAIASELGYELVSLAMAEDGVLHWMAFASSLPQFNEALKKFEPDLLVVNSKLAKAIGGEMKEYYILDDPTDIFPSSLVYQLNEDDVAHIGKVEHSMVYPLRYEIATLGVLIFTTHRDISELSQYEREAITGIIGLVSLALYKAKVYEDLQKTTKSLRETTHQLEGANKQLKDLDKAKSEFLSIASHQLYTPLTALRGYLSMLIDGDYGHVANDQKPVIDILNKSATRLIGLIKNLLDITRIEAGRLELNLESVDLVTMAREMVQDLMPNAVNKGLTLKFDDPPQPVSHVIADQQRIRQVTLNFIDNSIKYTDTGFIEVKVEQANDEVVFSVSDTGKGITADEIDKLFTKFTRVGGAARYHTEGTGLGLYVARQIVREHHGEVEVTSPGTGKGSTFTMRLPIEGSAKSLKLGEKAVVEIKAAEVQKEDDEAAAKAAAPVPTAN